jgi:hypothetical protein
MNLRLGRKSGVKTADRFTRQTEAATAIRRRVIDILTRLGLMPDAHSLMRNGEDDWTVQAAPPGDFGTLGLSGGCPD